MTDARAAWLDALPLVWFTLTRMRADGELQQPLDDDILQEGYLAAGLALRRWTPERGPAAPLIVAYVRGRVLSHLNRQHNGGVGSGRQQVTMLHLPENRPLPGAMGSDDNPPPDGPPDSLTYADPPEGYDDPALTAERVTMLKQVRFAVDLLKPEYREVLKATYGLEAEPVTLAAYAVHHGLTMITARRRRASALDRLRVVLGVV